MFQSLDGKNTHKSIITSEMLVGIAVPKQNMSKSSWIIECVMTPNWNPKISKNMPWSAGFMNPAGSLNCFKSPAQSLILKSFKNPKRKVSLFLKIFKNPEHKVLLILKIFKNLELEVFLFWISLKTRTWGYALSQRTIHHWFVCSGVFFLDVSHSKCGEQSLMLRASREQGFCINSRCFEKCNVCSCFLKTTILGWGKIMGCEVPSNFSTKAVWGLYM